MIEQLCLDFNKKNIVDKQSNYSTGYDCGIEAWDDDWERLWITKDGFTYSMFYKETSKLPKYKQIEMLFPMEWPDSMIQELLDMREGLLK